MNLFSGSQAAIAGGVTTIGNMTFQWRGETLRQALAIGRRSPLRWHPAMAEALKHLADHVKDRDDGKEAAQLYREALTIAQHRLPKDHPLRRELVAKLAEFLRKHGRDREAEAVEQDAN